jgi:hypothetical protein
VLTGAVRPPERRAICATGSSMKWLKLALEIIGAVSLLLAIIVGVTIYKNLSDRRNRATNRDVRYVLNWGGISTKQHYHVIASYQSSRNLTGDHLDYYCIQLSDVSVAEFAKDEWHNGPELNPILVDALNLGLSDAHRYANCMPSEQEANSPEMKINFVSVVLDSKEATAADILLLDPASRRLYFISYKT